MKKAKAESCASVSERTNIPFTAATSGSSSEVMKPQAKNNVVTAMNAARTDTRLESMNALPPMPVRADNRITRYNCRALQRCQRKKCRLFRRFGLQPCDFQGAVHGMTHCRVGSRHAVEALKLLHLFAHRGAHDQPHDELDSLAARLAKEFEPGNLAQPLGIVREIVEKGVVEFRID